MKILHTGTFDVYNYGDLLFPLILKRMLGMAEKGLSFLSPTDSSPILADSVSTKGILNSVECIKSANVIIIGGGNIIHSEQTKLEYYQKHHDGYFSYDDLWALPALISNSKARVLWNAPGVPSAFSPHLFPILKEVLSKTDYICVRDNQSKNHLTQVCPQEKIRVIPDTAWQLDQVWSKSELKHLGEKIYSREIGDTVKGAWVIHLNARYIKPNSAEEIANIIERISKERLLLPVLLPIGQCHGDHHLAQKIGSLLRTSHLVLDKLETLKAIAATIASADLYTGSSMHGFITSAVYDVPGFIVANGNMGKFDGLSDLLNRNDLVVKDWADLCSVLDSCEFEEQLRQLSEKKIDINRALVEHWKTIVSLYADQNISIASESFSSTDLMKVQRNMSYYKILSVRNKFAKKEHEFNQKNSELGNVINSKREQLKQALKVKLEADQKIDILNKNIEQARSNFEKVSKELLYWQEESARFEDQLTIDRENNQALKMNNEKLEMQIQRTRSSVSWRLTKPLRYLSKRYQKL